MMYRKLISLMMFISLVSSAIASEQKKQLILVTAETHILHEIKKYYNINQSGRLQFLKYKRGVSFETVPQHIRKYVKSISQEEVLQISHQDLSSNLSRFNLGTKFSNEIHNLLTQVNSENIYLTIKKITDQKNRRSGAPGNQWTTAYIENEFKKHNLIIEKDCFSPGLCNVIGTQRGNFKNYLVLEAHLDSVGRPYAGADDNASGVAALLEIMRLVSNINGEMGLIFFATNGEESGLLGAKTFVANAKKTGLIDKLSFVINMDMIAYNENGQVDIETDRKYEDVAKWYAAIFNSYTKLKANITMPAWGSDHVPFLRSGVPGVLTIEHWNTRNPCYHQECDTIDKLNIDYATEITKANLAAICIKAKLNL